MVCRRRGRKVKAQGLFPIGLFTFVFISFEREGVYLLLNEQWSAKEERTETTEGRKGGEGSE